MRSQTISTSSVFAALLACAGFGSGKPSVDSQIAVLEASNSTLLQYPTQFTQNIVPKAIHSHNDYWRDVPLFTALSFGVASVEADVWLINGTLFVGHELAALSDARTFSSLYVGPLVKIIEAQNPRDKFTLNQTSFNGVFDTAGDVPLQLLVDIKTDGVEALPFILKAMEPLRERGFLSTFENGTLNLRPVLVIGTGNSPLEQVKALSPRDYFFDAPLDHLNNATLNPSWDPSLAPIASADFGDAIGWTGISNITDEQRTTILGMLNDAHSRGIKARFYDTPAWPINARTRVWLELMDDGADWLNADDLEAASQF